MVTNYFGGGAESGGVILGDTTFTGWGRRAEPQERGKRRAGDDGIKRKNSRALKSNIVRRGEREQMAVENVSLTDPGERAMLTDLAVFH